MAKPSLKQAVKWFEERFAEVHVYDSSTHPSSLHPSMSPNGERYLTMVNGIFVLEGEIRPPREYTEEDTAQKWYGGACALWELRGRPSHLWWRTLPEYEDGMIYSRFVMTHRGAFVREM